MFCIAIRKPKLFIPNITKIVRYSEEKYAVPSIYTETLKALKYRTCCPPPPCLNFKIKRAAEHPALFITDFEERNKHLFKRPLSPCLSIYKKGFHLKMSIGHRATGIILAIYMFMLGVGGALIPCEFEYYVEGIEELELSQYAIIPAKYVIAFPFIFHFCTGIRHLIWDLGYFLTNKSVFYTGRVALVTAIVVTAALSVIDCSCEELE